MFLPYQTSAMDVLFITVITVILLVIVSFFSAAKIPELYDDIAMKNKDYLIKDIKCVSFIVYIILIICLLFSSYKLVTAFIELEENTVTISNYFQEKGFYVPTQTIYYKYSDMITPITNEVITIDGGDIIPEGALSYFVNNDTKELFIYYNGEKI